MKKKRDESLSQMFTDLRASIDRVVSSHERVEKTCEALLLVSDQALELLDEAVDDNKRLREALGFARSVIKSGEPWTDECERVIDGTLEETKYTGS